MTPPRKNYVAVPIPGPKAAATIFAAISALLLLTIIPLAATTMRVPHGNCGTIFASSETWKYNSFADDAKDYATQRFRSSGDLSGLADDLVEGMLADVNLGSAVYDMCKEKHKTRLIWISIVGVGAASSGILALYFFRRSRQSLPPPTA